ncbi:nicotinate phosphoribosyltransferase [Agarilytica rhodophyticola]|uniref:nicotinate phosphoribosyltransferase n=1 Tax=Agarilytica rhodophyticola TaxID=1737490 RepID=UPI001C1F9534|nr:nicotinate phosphoribosyltransferase [Agarilytica rhodophyticola]
MMNPLMAIDFYKADHRRQYPEGTEYVYSNFTPRSARLANVLEGFDERVVFLGLQAYIKRILIEQWQREFFDKPKEDVLKKYKRRMDTSLGEDAISTEHIEALHDLGYLPIKIKALEEGSRVNIKVPVFTVVNTLPEFFWLTNYLETSISAEVWKPCTTATIAYEYKRLLKKFADDTGAPLDFLPIQAHDFSFRGMSGAEDAALAGLGHLASFMGTDTVAAIDYAEDYYKASELVGVSVPATEHSVMCMGTKESEIDTFKRLINDLYPHGIVSIVSDTWDFWQVINEFARELKDDILNRKRDALGFSKVVFRPDSGDPVKVICGDPDAKPGSPENKGAVECLWDIFGGSVTEKGYKLLSDRVGIIYGDSITLQRAEAILAQLKEKGFASTNVVFGVGSYTYQHVTRDTFGFAMKATWGQVKGEGRDIFKDPVTDKGEKKSAIGLLRVEQTDNGFQLFDKQTPEQEQQGIFQTVFQDGKLLKETTFEEIRKRLEY